MLREHAGPVSIDVLNGETSKLRKKGGEEEKNKVTRGCRGYAYAHFDPLRFEVNGPIRVYLNKILLYLELRETRLFYQLHNILSDLGVHNMSSIDHKSCRARPGVPGVLCDETHVTEKTAKKS